MTSGTEGGEGGPLRHGFAVLPLPKGEVSASPKHPVKERAQSLPPSRGKVARPKAVTDEGARQVIASYRKNCLPAPPPHPPPAGAPSPRRVEGFSLRGTEVWQRQPEGLTERAFPAAHIAAGSAQSFFTCGYGLTEGGADGII